MIIFLNFAPIDFFGGAERWMLRTATDIHQGKPCVLIHADRPIANVYGRFVMGRTFESRTVFQDNSDLPRVEAIRFIDFLPFTSGWKKKRKLFQSSEYLYIRFEVLECLILIYFGGFASLKKSVAGVHSAFFYYSPRNFFDYFHNLVYQSRVCSFFMKKFKKVHVLTERDQLFFQNTFHLTNTVLIPNSIEIPEPKFSSHTEKLKILFVGELTEKKGCDILLQVMDLLPEGYSLSIAGDGPMKQDILAAIKERKRNRYYGYLSKERLKELFLTTDVLFLPSRMETLPTVILEAISFGLKVVDSKEIGLGLPEFIEYTNKDNSIDRYIEIFRSIAKQKTGVRYLDERKEIYLYAKKNYSRDVISTKFREAIFA